MSDLPPGPAQSTVTVDRASQWTFASQTRDGRPILVRPLRPDDREREVAFINSLSLDSKYLRLLTPMRFLSKHLLDQLMEIDGSTRMAFVATLGDREDGRIIGIARYGVTDQNDVAELGITVADDWHRTGIATLLIQTLCRYASGHGIRRLTGFVLPHNFAMLALAKSLGFAVHHGNDGLKHIELELNPRLSP